MKSKHMITSLPALAFSALVLHGLLAQPAAAQTTLYSGSSTTTFTWSNTSAVWGTNPAGPFTLAWQAGADAVFLNSGTVTVSGTINAVNSIDLGPDKRLLGDAAITLTGSATISGTGRIGSSSENTRLTGTAGLRKTGPGQILILAGNDYTGETLIEDGTLTLGGGNDRLPTGTVVTLGKGTSSGILQLGSATSNRNQTLAGLLTSGSGTANRVIGSGTTGLFSLLTLNIASGTNVYAGFLGGPGNSGTDAHLRLTKQGAGRLVLSANNPYVGATVVSAGVLEISPTGLINSTSGITVNGATAELQYNSATALTRPLTLTQGTLSGTGTISGAITLTGSATISGANTITSIISGSAGLRKTGPNQIFLRGTSNYTGGTFIEDGTLTLGEGNNRLPTGTVVTLGSGESSGILRIGANTTTREQTLAGLLTAGSGTENRVLGAGTSAASSSLLTLDIASGTNVYAGFLGGTGQFETEAHLRLTKQGAGRLVLSATSPYVGATLVSAGVLEISPTGLINSTSDITVNGATAEFKYNATMALSRPLTLTQGTLSGTGTIATAVTIGPGIVLAPGNSPGEQSYTSLHAWAPGGTYQWEFNALSGTPGVNWDFVNVLSGTFDLSGLAATPGSQFTLDLVSLAAGDVAGQLVNPYDGGSYTFAIASYDPANFLLPVGFSNTAGADLTSLFTINLANWQGPKPALGDISVKLNSSATGIDLVIVPEPGALALAGLGAALAGWLCRRRQLPVRN